MKIILIIFLLFFSIKSFAVDKGDWDLQRQVSIGQGKNDYGKRVYGQYGRTIMQNVPIKDGTSQSVKALIERSIAVDKPTPAKIGGSMLKRLYSPQAIVGTAAVSGLLAAIGWVMEEGVYVKKIKEDDTSHPDFQYKCSVGPLQNNVVDTVTECGHSYLTNHKSNPNPYLESVVSCHYTNNAFCVFKRMEQYGGTNTNYQVASRVPRQKPQAEDKKVPLTAAVLGAIMLGEGYSDPAGDTAAETKVNTGDTTGVKETYEHDPSGVGNEVADGLDNKARNAKPTPDGKPAPLGDPRYDDKGDLKPDDTSKDRKWQDDGDTATGGIEPEKDPITGDNTGNQSISLQFPIFCTWAFKMCAWYDDWKKSDQIYKDHATKTEQHQEKEKTFWEKVKDWFDWTKESPEDKEEPEQQEPDTQGIFSKKFDAVFSLSKQCPPDLKFNLDTKYLSGTWDFSLNWLCIFFTFIAYPLQLLSHMIGIWILYEACIRKEIKW